MTIDFNRKFVFAKKRNADSQQSIKTLPRYLRLTRKKKKCDSCKRAISDVANHGNAAKNQYLFDTADGGTFFQVLRRAEARFSVRYIRTYVTSRPSYFNETYLS